MEQQSSRSVRLVLSHNSQRNPSKGIPVVIVPTIDGLMKVAANKLKKRGRKSKASRLFVAIKHDDVWFGEELLPVDSIMSSLVNGAFVCLSEGEDFFGRIGAPEAAASDDGLVDAAAGEREPQSEVDDGEGDADISTDVMSEGTSGADYAQLLPAIEPSTTPSGDNRFVFFWRENHPFSNWYKSSFELDGIRYNCVEQAFMAAKAQMFEDEKILLEIRAAATPKHQKALGRRIRGFKPGPWRRSCRGKMMRACRAKFAQNARMRSALLGTGRATLVEASPGDTTWGIGLREDDVRARDPSRWRGTNWLGEVLMAVRAELEMVDDGVKDTEEPIGEQERRVGR